MLVHSGGSRRCLPLRVPYCIAQCVLITAQRWPQEGGGWTVLGVGVRIQLEAGMKGRGPDPAGI